MKKPGPSGPDAQAGPPGGNGNTIPTIEEFDTPGVTTDPVGPVAPVGPVGPVVPVGPVAPVAPVAPVGPAVPSSTTSSAGECELEPFSLLSTPIDIPLLATGLRASPKFVPGLSSHPMTVVVTSM